MIKYEKFELANGLKVIIHEDASTPMAAVNLLYDVGSRDESPEKTGFAHLFEHLMFGGSVNIPEYDTPLQKAGGTNNAFTSADITNYYEVLPASNIETAFWLESDRMLNLDFSQESLDVQKKVVAEEFKERNLNQPYGDVWHEMRKQTYLEHPYKWPVIGKNLEHIESFELEDVKKFFYKHYRPNNCILCVSGGVKAQEVLPLIEKWFGNIPRGEAYNRSLPNEPLQTEYRFKEITADVPLNALYINFKMPGRTEDDFYPIDFMSDLLSGGTSSRLYQSLIKEKQMFSSISAYITSSIDTGLFVIEGKLSENVDFKEAENAVWEELKKMKTDEVSEDEMTKVKHKIEAHIEFSQNSILNRAMDLCYFELINETELINTELSAYTNVNANQIKDIANKYFNKKLASVIHYKSSK